MKNKKIKIKYMKKSSQQFHGNRRKGLERKTGKFIRIKGKCRKKTRYFLIHITTCELNKNHCKD